MTDTTERAAWYLAYLDSGHWQTLRRRKLNQAGYLCARCRTRGKQELGDPAIGLHVHHLTYERLHQEQLDDLEVLCGWCHGEEHGIQSHPTREQWEASLVDRALRLNHHLADDIELELAGWDELAEKARL